MLHGFLVVGFLSLVLPFSSQAQEPVFTKGLAETTHAGLLDCGKRSRVSAVGRITADDGSAWIVPAETHFASASHATDLYNQCAGIERAGLAELDLAEVPVFDAGGDEVFTAYIFADNYFELYVNGELAAVDAVPFTPFNSSVVRFKAKRPVTLAILGVDWEENLGLGSENGRGSSFSPGDAGVVARILDAKGAVAAITDTSWRAQTFYVSPINEKSCLVINGSVRDSAACSTAGSNSADGLLAAHWEIPVGWEQVEFDSSAWPQAVTFSNETVGVNNKPAYTNFTELFDAADADAEFIWSSNLVLDNLVLMRKTIE